METVAFIISIFCAIIASVQRVKKRELFFQMFFIFNKTYIVFPHIKSVILKINDS